MGNKQNGENDLDISEETQAIKESGPSDHDHVSFVPSNLHQEPLLVTRIRQAITPYLPPPVVNGIQRTDPILEPYMGPEGTISIIFSLLVAYGAVRLIRFVTARLTGKGKAIANDNESGILGASNLASSFDTTVILCGPPEAGKTRLFYELCYDQAVPTLSSLKANVGIVTMKDTRVRIMDWPGYASLTDSVLKPVWTSTPRVVFLLDATQPMAAAADCLDQLLSLAKPLKRKLCIFVACHKKDLAKAKNPKRVQLQLRTELERLLQSKSANDPDQDNNCSWWPTGKPLDLKELDFVELYFLATTCEGEGCPEIKEYCRTGKIPSVKET